MKQKLFPNIRRLTNLFCLGIFCVTAAALTLRLTVFSEMADSVPETAVSSMVESEQGGYKINGRPVFATAASKGDVFISNVEGNAYSINVDIILEEDGKSIFTSGFIKPGNSMASTKLNPLGQQLEDGLYPCVAEITAHDPVSLKPVGSAEEKIVIQIGDADEGETDAGEDKNSSSDETDETEPDIDEDPSEDETEETDADEEPTDGDPEE